MTAWASVAGELFRGDRARKRLDWVGASCRTGTAWSSARTSCRASGTASALAADVALGHIGATAFENSLWSPILVALGITTIAGGVGGGVPRLLEARSGRGGR